MVLIHLATLKEQKPRLCFWLKVFLLLFPFLPIVCVYFYSDPDMILHKYKRFDQSKVFLGEAYVGWQNYLQNRDSIAYNSFIMGNSCTMAFKTEAWEKYLSKDSKAVRFFDNAESIGGVLQKIRALDSVEAKMDNILLIIDAKSLINPNPQQKTFNLFSPQVAGISKTSFILRHLQSFLMPSYCLPYIEYLLTGKYKARMKCIIETPPIREPYTNNFINPREKEIMELGEEYWIKHKDEFSKRERSPGVDEQVTIFTSQKNVLKGIKSLCDKNHTNINIIIDPHYSQKKINPADLKVLQDTFGNNCIWDFTGVNEFTEDYHHYYEPAHYRPCLGNKLLKVIYN